MIGLRTIRRGQHVAVWNANGEVHFVAGPRRLLLFRQWIEPLRHYSAESHEFLAVRFLDGHTENIRGPAEIWFNPVEHEFIEVEQATAIDAHEALVVYQRQTDETVTRRVLHGPAQYVPQANEWLHEFQWHGADPRNPLRKIPRALKFSKLRIIPDQMYFDVRDVRTADDALLIVQLMVFFELVDIERMLDQTHDPIADFINDLAADVIDFAARRSFESFKESTGQLNELDQYTNLANRAERIGYRINKVVYRGYLASDKLQAMHDDAIETRTGLKLEAETERQAQELADLKLAREAQRDEQRRQMQTAQAEHDQELQQLQHDGELHRRESLHQQKLAQRKAMEAQAVAHREAQNQARLKFLHEMQNMQVDLTRYLVAQYQHPDRLIRLEGVDNGQLHVHDN